jgi:hypothetical protein
VLERERDLPVAALIVDRVAVVTLGGRALGEEVEVTEVVATAAEWIAAGRRSWVRWYTRTTRTRSWTADSPFLAWQGLEAAATVSTSGCASGGQFAVTLSVQLASKSGARANAAISQPGGRGRVRARRVG